MTDDATPPGLTPRDRATEARGRVRRRRGRWIALAAAIVVAVLAATQLAFGWVGRVVDATGLTCGGGWERIEGDELTRLQVIRWGTPQAREQGFDPEEFADMPTGLAEPTLTTFGSVATGAYDPSLHPLAEGAVLQADGFVDRTWVASDAHTGEPLWGISESLEGGGFSTPQGLFVLVSIREDGRTDLTTFAPRTGEELSCVRLPGRLRSVTEVGETDIAVAVAHETGEDGAMASTVLRLDPTTGEQAWHADTDLTAASLSSDGELLLVAQVNPGDLVDNPIPTYEDPVVALDAGTGAELWQRRSDALGSSVLAVMPLADGDSGTLLLDLTDERDADDNRLVDYVLLDDSGTEIWRVRAASKSYVADAWPAGDAVVVLDGAHPMALDVATGEQRWRSEAYVGDDRAVLLDVGGAPTLLVTEGRDVSDDGDVRFFSTEIDVATGTEIEFDAPMRSAVLAEGYLISSTGLTQLVVPLG